MGIIDAYHYYNTESVDKRTKDFFLIGSPIPIILMTISYLYFVKRCGPNYMKDKKPYSLHTFIRLYNVFQIVANSLIVYHAFDAGWYRDYFFYCHSLEYSFSTPGAYKILILSWFIFFLKLIDYIETAIYVLRKKDRQISFLHLYHHVSTVFIAWNNVKHYPVGVTLTVSMVNCTVHVIMYTYYLLSSLGPKMQQVLYPVKKVITIIQMTQFLGLMAWALQVLLPHCTGLAIPATIMIINLLINLKLFYNFYKQTYGPQTNKVK